MGVVLSRFSQALRCPLCLRGVLSDKNGWRCTECHRHFSVSDGLHDFFVETDATVAPDLVPYTDKFRSDAVAQNYADNFERQSGLRARTLRELGILEDFLDGDPCPTVLNIPCGGGRLSSPMRRPGTVLIEADTSPGQIRCNQQQFEDRAETVWMLATAFHLPFADASIDTAVCVRLSHHLSERVDRERLLAELIRVARRRVIFTFRNRISMTSLWRRLRGKPIHENVMSLDDVAHCATRHGARLVRWRSVSRFGSRHTYALLNKVPDSAHAVA